MLHGHHGAGLFFSGLSSRKHPLYIYFLASQFQDLVISVLVYFVGIEKTRIQGVGPNKVFPIVLLNVPYSHGLFFNLIYVIMFSILISPSIGMTILSHFILDFIVHLPDMDICFPFSNGDGCKIGLGLWRYLWPSIMVESGIIIIGAIIYIFKTPGDERKNVCIRLIPVVIFMILMTVLLPFSPPPESLGWVNGAQALVFYGLFMILGWAIESGSRKIELKKE